MKYQKHIRFDWAIKKALRSKANFGVLEGFLSELLGKDIKIPGLLESEGNRETETDKSNRVDIDVEDSNGDLYIVEVQNHRELDYFYKIVYNTSKATAYTRYMESPSLEASLADTIKFEKQFERDEGRKESAIEIARKMKEMGIAPDITHTVTKLDPEIINEL
jgi:hypothetical protein